MLLREYPHIIPDDVLVIYTPSNLTAYRVYLVCERVNQWQKTEVIGKHGTKGRAHQLATLIRTFIVEWKAAQS